MTTPCCVCRRAVDDYWIIGLGDETKYVCKPCLHRLAAAVASSRPGGYWINLDTGTVEAIPDDADEQKGGR